MNDEKNKNNGEFDEENFFELMMSGEVPITFKLIVVIIPLLYTMMPIDLLPEAILGPLGLVDDAGVWMLGAQLFTTLGNRHLEQQHEEEQKRKNEDQATIIQEPPYSARAQSANAQPNTNAPDGRSRPHLPEHHLRRHGQLPAGGEPQAEARQPLGYDTSALTDEEHEQLILKKQSMSDEAFNEMMRARGLQRKDDWDFSRNDAFSQRQNRNGKASS